MGSREEEGPPPSVDGDVQVFAKPALDHQLKPVFAVLGGSVPLDGKHVSGMLRWVAARHLARKYPHRLSTMRSASLPYPGGRKPASPPRRT